MANSNPTLYDNFTRVKDWAVDKFADKETLASTLSDVAFSGDYDDLENKPDLSTYVTQTALEGMSYATETYVSNAIAAIPGVDLTGYATETYVTTAIENLVNSAPAALDTLEELAAALGDDPNFATTIATQMGNKADKSDVYTKNDINGMSYVSTTVLSSCGYLTAVPSEYITETELSNCGYLTGVPNDYPTYTAIQNMSYVSQTALSGMAYVTALTQNEMDTLFPISNE